MGRRNTFWITSEDLFSSQPSAIQATEATMNITNPATVMRALMFAATIAAARMVVQAARVLSMASSSMSVPKTKGRPIGAGSPWSPASSRKLSSLALDAFERHRVQLAVRRLFLIEVLLQDGGAVATA